MKSYRKPRKPRTSIAQRITAWVMMIALLVLLVMTAAQISSVVAEVVCACGIHVPVGQEEWPDNGYPWAMVNAWDVCVRSGPGLNHDVLFSVSYGSAVEVIGEENGWMQCYHWTVPGRPVWIWGEYLQVK